MLSLLLSGDRYLPFEGTGTVGAWILELPKIQQFDYGISPTQYFTLDTLPEMADQDSVLQ